ARRDDEVAGEDDLETERDGEALDGRDQRLVGWPLHDPAGAAALDVRALATHERLEVHARAERPAGAGEDARPQLGVAVELVQRGGDRLRGGQVHRVAGLGAVEGDHQDAVAALREDGRVGHRRRAYAKSARSGPRAPRTT